nr:MAG TPA: hypothetical protein [Caudoviricetes sp.]
MNVLWLFLMTLNWVTQYQIKITFSISGYPPIPPPPVDKISGYSARNEKRLHKELNRRLDNLNKQKYQEFITNNPDYEDNLYGISNKMHVLGRWKDKLIRGQEYDADDIQKDILKQITNNMKKKYGEPTYKSPSGSTYFENNGDAYRVSNHDLPQTASREYYRNMYGDKYKQNIVVQPLDQVDQRDFDNILDKITKDSRRRIQDWYNRRDGIMDNYRSTNNKLAAAMKKLPKKPTPLSFKEYIDLVNQGRIN